MKKQHLIALSLIAAAVVAGCASAPGSADLDKMAADIVKSSFRDQGIVKVSVLAPEDINTVGSRRMAIILATGKKVRHWRKVVAVKRGQTRPTLRMAAIATTATSLTRKKFLLAPSALASQGMARLGASPPTRPARRPKR